jgi:hypothetical protein
LVAIRGKSLGAVRAKLTDIAFDDDAKRIVVAAKIVDDERRTGKAIYVAAWDVERVRVSPICPGRQPALCRLIRVRPDGRLCLLYPILRLTMKRILSAVAFVTGLIVALAVPPSGKAGTMLLFGLGSGSAGFSPSCSQSAAFLARATGVTQFPGYESGIDALICGGVSDGWWAKLDELYVVAAPTQAIADLNLISSSNPITPSGTLIFDPYVGYTGDGSTTVLTTANFSGGGYNYTQNSASVGGCEINARTATNGAGYFSVMYTASSAASIVPRFSAGNYAGWQINNSGSYNTNSTQTTTQGTYEMVRTASNASAIYYQCASSSCSPTGTSTVASVSVPNTTMKFIDTGGDTESWFFAGEAITATDAYNMRTRMNTFLSTVGGLSGC